MHVLITNFHPGDGGGHTTYIQSLVLAKNSSVNYTVAAPATSKLAKVCSHNGVDVIPIDFPGKFKEWKDVKRSVERTINLLKSRQFDLVHVNGSPDHKIIVLSIIFGKLPYRPKILFTKHNSFRVKKDLWSKIKHRHFCDGVIVVCKKLKLEYENLLKDDRIFFVENGVDTFIYAPSSKSRKAELRRRFGLEPDQIMLVSCSGTAEHKGWQLIANVVSGQKNLLVVPLGSEPSDGLLLKLFPSGLPSNLKFVGHQEDVRPFLHMADVGFVLSTSVETISFACREMMACGLPVIVSDYGCLQENVTESTGWVTHAGSEQSIAIAVDSILKADLSKMGTAARLRAVENFGLDQFLERTSSVYFKVCGF